jgi:hypothetical protein
MVCIGTFVGQHFRWLSADPNTVFQFLFFQDRLILLKVGTARDSQ